jgi:DNA-binding response OmpR family regulator
MTAAAGRILCVNDEPSIFHTLETFLVPKGYEVISVQNGAEALEKLKAEKIDLVLQDVKMPDPDGYEICRRIKGDERTLDIPVIMITKGKTERMKGVEAGAEDFISLPLNEAEVLARVQMLLKGKGQPERRIGELLIEMGFINEEKLQEALRISKGKNIKVGEALISMGALDIDHIYWVLSTQLGMIYIELSPEMIDHELVRQFSIENLEQLLCVPLYETTGEIHFAVADPTNNKIVKQVKSLRPQKNAQLHLALPEKIADVLDLLKQESFSKAEPSINARSKEKGGQPRFAKTVKWPDPSMMENHWTRFVTFLLSMSPGETCWLYKNFHDCRLMTPKGRTGKTVHQYPEKIYSFIQEQLRKEMTSPDTRTENWLFLQEKNPPRQGAFKWSEMKGLDKDIIHIARIPEFSQEEFFLAHPQAPELSKGLQRFFDKNGRLIVGGREKLFVEQCFYAIVNSRDDPADLPLAYLLEGKIEMFFPKTVQLQNSEINVSNVLDRLPEGPILSMFLEPEFPGIWQDQKTLSRLFSGIYKNVFLYFPVPSLEAMRQVLAEREEWRSAGFEAVFFQPYQWMTV